MSFRLNRIRRAMAQPPQEPFTHHLNNALCAHWKSLFEREFKRRGKKVEKLGAILLQQQQACADAEEKHQAYVAATLALWETKRDAFQLEATLGGLPGPCGPLCSGDYGTHWILFHWTPPQTGGPVWGYRIERSTDNLHFYLADIGVEPEIALLNQPQNVKLYYRVVAFNGWGDAPVNGVFGIKFNAKLQEVGKRRRRTKATKTLSADPTPETPNSPA